MTPNVGMLPGASAINSKCDRSDAPGSIPTEGLPQHKNIRAEFHNYSGGIYFITICTKEKKHYFGSITESEMVLTTVGYYTQKCLAELHTHYPYVNVPMFVVMPNHIHAIIIIREPADAPGSIPTIRTALGVVIGGFKQSVTRYARRNNIEFGWQLRFHDHIIRGPQDGNRIAEYIATNVNRWASDCYNI